jgi:hypothetical protein
MYSPRNRKLAVAVAVAAAVLIPAVQQGFGLGQSQAEFAARGDETLRAAGYAFSIWGLIYLGLVIFAVHHTRSRDSRALAAIGWPAALAALGCGLWIVAAAANAMSATVIIILTAAAGALTAVLRGAPLATGRDRLLALIPVALLAGWLTVAAPLNVLTALSAAEMIPPWAMGAAATAGVALVLVVALLVTWKSRVWAYPLPAAWGLVAVYVAERADKPVIAWTALAAAVALVLAAAMAGIWRQPA